MSDLRLTPTEIAAVQEARERRTPPEELAGKLAAGESKPAPAVNPDEIAQKAAAVAVATMNAQQGKAEAQRVFGGIVREEVDKSPFKGDPVDLKQIQDTAAAEIQTKPEFAKMNFEQVQEALRTATKAEIARRVAKQTAAGNAEKKSDAESRMAAAARVGDAGGTGGGSTGSANANAGVDEESGLAPREFGPPGTVNWDNNDSRIAQTSRKAGERFLKKTHGAAAGAS